LDTSKRSFIKEDRSSIQNFNSALISLTVEQHNVKSKSSILLYLDRNINTAIIIMSTTLVVWCTQYTEANFPPELHKDSFPNLWLKSARTDRVPLNENSRIIKIIIICALLIVILLFSCQIKLQQIDNIN
jgi:hypothetical protein